MERWAQGLQVKVSWYWGVGGCCCCWGGVVEGSVVGTEAGGEESDGGEVWRKRWWGTLFG